jgi:DNA-3-methyladenine glycosylase II
LFKTLNNENLAVAAGVLAQSDQDLARILRNHGPPPLWARKPGFVTLVRIILEQQVSLASADAMYRRLVENIDPLTPQEMIATGTAGLRSLGVTRQKAGYFINIASAIEEDRLDLEGIVRKPDGEVFEQLTSVKGIGPWTANIYLLMALCRPDVWPVGDIALAAAFKKLKDLSFRPTQSELAETAEAWRPHRATAARMLWHYYLSEKANRKHP